MSMYHGNPSLSRRFRLFQSSFLQMEGLPFAEVLPEKRIEEIFAEEGGEFAEDEDCIYTPPVTLWAWLSQVLFKEEQRACLAAVFRVSVLMMSLGREPCSTNTGAYCRARSKLPEPVIRRLSEEVAAGCEQSVPDDWLWHRRHVCLVDGSTESMPDTRENRDEYPQNVAQQEGLGFPIVRLVVLLSLATAMVRGMAFGRYAGKETGETALLRQLLDGVDRDTILLTDRYFCSYFMIALVLLGQRDFVTRLHQRRKTDFRKGKRLGKGDYLVEWQRPARPKWMDQATYDRIPETITVRQIEVQVREPGFRVESLIVVTTLSDAREYPAKDIGDLYRKRWLAELDIRAIKCSLGMDVLRCKTPAMVRAEMWTGTLAYNLIRKAMLESAKEAGLSPRQLSFTAAMDAIAASLPHLSWLEGDLADTLIAAALAGMAEHVVGNRPNRVEPRAVKRRPQPLALLTKPRDQARAELLRGVA
jgi:DDE family transposase